ncbi:MAG: histidine kinase [Burkholderiales bacterium]|nr:histidine kinase [Burkholderiales bacterium]
MSSFLFVFRIAFAWALSWLTVIVLWTNIVGRGKPWMFVVAVFITLVVVTIGAISHVRRVRLIADRVDSTTLASRHRRRIEIPLAAGEAFTLVDAAIRELPYVKNVESARDSLQVRARLKRIEAYGASGARKNRILATVTPGEGASSLTLICEPEGGAWVDWFMVDDGTNLENAEAVTRALSRRIGEHRKLEQATARQTATEKELTVAKLNLLHAQVEPHFLYNTLASAQLLTRADPAKADQMLGNLIVYLRNSLPRTEGEMSTVGAELESARAYLEIMKIRMGDRLSVQLQVPGALESTPMPPMMMQTLVENAIKHGLEPVTGGGTIWIIARETDGKVAITVADNGRGFGGDSAGTGVGLRNIRERLRLAYGEGASFAIVPNFPNGVTATITLPAAHA